MQKDALDALDGVLLDGLDFCSTTYKLFESIRALPDGITRLRLRKSRVEKKLIEELLPISAYVQSCYRPGRYLSVKWLAGNQQCDAEIVQHGEYVRQGYFPDTGFIEATSVVHEKEHDMRKLLETKGFAFGHEGIRRLKNGELESTPVSYSVDELVATFSGRVLAQIQAKSRNPFSANTILVVQCFLTTLYMPNEWRSLVSRVSAGLPRHPFSEIFLCDSVSQYSHTFHRLRDD